jgi:hypothetical protein
MWDLGSHPLTHQVKEGILFLEIFETGQSIEYWVLKYSRLGKVGITGS